jgi:hypothetical protein
MTEATENVEVNEEELLELRAMFQSKGWELLMSRVEEALDNSKNIVWTLKDDREIAVLQGNVHTLQWISAQPQITEHLLAEDVNEEEDAFI